MIERKRDDSFFVIGILLLSFLNVFAISGYANRIAFTEIATIFTLLFLVFRIVTSSQKNSDVDNIDIVVFAVCLLYLLGMVFEWKSFYQLTNLVTLFGISLWIKTFSKLKWDERRFSLVGIASSFFAVLLIFLFLPGNVLSGWNNNSSICVIPAVVFSIACLVRSKQKWKNWMIFFVSVLVMILLLQLENRSSFFSFLLFLIILLTKKIYKSRAAFRGFYITLIAINLLLPLFFEFATNWKLFEIISDFMETVFDKTGLNGREEVWGEAVEVIKTNPWLGTFGYRKAYFHNFSLDVLTQFGFIGWILFFTVLIIILEKSFKENQENNLFLIGFLCLLFLNTFESVLFCNNAFMIFSYVLLGMCWNKPVSSSVKNKQ